MYLCYSDYYVYRLLIRKLTRGNTPRDVKTTYLHMYVFKLEMGRNRYRVLGVSGQFQSIGMAEKSDTEYFLIPFRYFSDTYILVYYNDNLQ